MLPKEFIQQVLINELGEIHSQHPYIAFATMAIGVEFLGKCLNDHDDWNFYAAGIHKQDFKTAMSHLKSFKKYRPYLQSHDLWNALRNGFSHSFVPKNTLSLSGNDDMEHLVEYDGRINLNCDDFYEDFKSACEEVIAMTSFPSNKMDLPLITVPSN